jgi:hypothetical protein
VQHVSLSDATHEPLRAADGLVDECPERIVVEVVARREARQQLLALART